MRLAAAAGSLEALHAVLLIQLTLMFNAGVAGVLGGGVGMMTGEGDETLGAAGCSAGRAARARLCWEVAVAKAHTQRHACALSWKV